MTDIAAVVRFVHLTAAVLLAGAFSFTLLIARPAFRRVADESRAEFAALCKIQLRITRWCWLALVASALLGLWLQTLAAAERVRRFLGDSYSPLAKRSTATSGRRE